MPHRFCSPREGPRRYFGRITLFRRVIGRPLQAELLHPRVEGGRFEPQDLGGAVFAPDPPAANQARVKQYPNRWF